MKIGIIIEARTNSSRLPQKTIRELIPGVPMVLCLIHRLRPAEVDEIILATTTNPGDDILCQWAEAQGIKCFRGSESNVLERVYLAAKKFDINTIIEITADNVLVDYRIVDEFVAVFKNSYPKYDFVGNYKTSYPRGIVVYVFKMQSLQTIYETSEDEEDKEHVSISLYTSSKFKALNIPAPPQYQYPHFRLTVDTIEDFKVIQHIFKNLYPQHGFLFSLDQIIDYLKQHPKILEINSGVKQKTPRRLH